MKKLMLDIDALEVESFDTLAARPADTRGTVIARGTIIADTVRYTEVALYTCDPVGPPTAATCAYPCDTTDETAA